MNSVSGMSDQSIQMWQGDCLELMHRIPDGSIDCIIADLPYGTTNCAWDSVIPFEPLWAHYKRVIKKNGAIVLFGSQPFTSALVMSNSDWFKYQWIWLKDHPTGFSHCANMPLRNYEDIAVFSRGAIAHKHLCKNRMPYNPQGLKPYGKDHKRASMGFEGANDRRSQYKQKATEFTNYPRMVLDFPSEQANRGLHPTQKPVALLEYLIHTYTNEGEVVLDNTCGSGTMMVAAVNTGRCGIGIEQNETYFEIAQKRVADAQAAKSLSLFAEAQP